MTSLLKHTRQNWRLGTLTSTLVLPASVLSATEAASVWTSLCWFHNRTCHQLNSRCCYLVMATIRKKKKISTPSARLCQDCRSHDYHFGCCLPWRRAVIVFLVIHAYLLSHPHLSGRVLWLSTPASHCPLSPSGWLLGPGCRKWGGD